MILDVDALVIGGALLFVTIRVQLKKLQEPVTCTDCQPTIIKIPRAGEGSRLSWDCNLFL
jgi:hypothetical protein